MSTNNKVFQVLVPSGNQAVAVVGTGLEDLKQGQIGVFDEHTKLAIDGTALKSGDEIFIAVGRPNISDIDLSAGQTIPVGLLEAITVQDYTPAVNQKQLIHNFGTPTPDMDYTVRFEIRNGQIAQTMGTIGYYQSFSFKTGPAPTKKSFVKSFIQALKLDQDKNAFYKATVVNTATLAEVTDIDGAADNVDLGILIESVSIKELIYAGTINPVYFKNRQSIINISLLDNLADSGAKVTEKVASVQEEGSGYDLRQLEYQAFGWKNNHIYRASDVTGLELPGAKLYVDNEGEFNTIHLTYENKGYAGWSSYKHPLQTIVAIPKDNATTYTGFKAILDAIAGKAPHAEVFSEVVDDTE